MKNQKGCEYAVPKTTEFSVGLELEFFIRHTPSIKHYFQDTIESYGMTVDPEADVYELADILDCECGDDLYDHVLGFDGAGTETPEFRTPVFLSTTIEHSLDGILEFVETVQTDLVHDYKARFRPIYNNCPYGMHFSIGGKFLTKNNAFNIIKNCKDLQPKLPSLVPDSVLADFEQREYHYPGDLSEIDLDDFDLDDIPDINGIRKHPSYWEVERLELRFFPSCFIYSLEECLRFILMGAKFPTKKIKFSRC